MPVDINLVFSEASYAIVVIDTRMVIFTLLGAHGTPVSGSAVTHAVLSKSGDNIVGVEHSFDMRVVQHRRSCLHTYRNSTLVIRLQKRTVEGR